MASAPDYPLLTERLLLRPFEDRDLDAFHAMRSNAEHTRHVPYDPASREDVAKVLEQRKEWTALAERDSAITLAAVERQSDRFVGDMLLFHFDPTHRSAELGFAFDNPCHGKGYATEASRALVTWAFREAGLHRIHARCDAPNVASVRVLQKLGFRQEGRLVQSVSVEGAWEDTLLFGLLASEWPD